MSEIKKKPVPEVGKMFSASMIVQGVAREVPYKVTGVSGLNQHTPNPDSQIVYLELARRTGFNVENFIALPLDRFEARFKEIPL